jgi:hypothetical protein
MPDHETAPPGGWRDHRDWKFTLDVKAEGHGYRATAAWADDGAVIIDAFAGEAGDALNSAIGGLASAVGRMEVASGVARVIEGLGDTAGVEGAAPGTEPEPE